MIGRAARPILHSYTFHHYSLDEFIDYATRFGWPAVELASCHLAEDPAPAVHRVQRAGVEVAALGYYADLTTGSGADRDRAVQALVERIQLCAGLGVPRLNGFAGWVLAEEVGWSEWLRHGSRLGRADQRAWFAEGYTLAGKEAEAAGVQLLVEVHPNTLHDTTGAALDLLATVESAAVGITLDPGNSVPLDARDSVPPATVPEPAYFHFKNVLTAGGVTSFDVDADRGQVDLTRWLQRLPESAAVCIEYPGHGDPHPRLQAARTYYQSIIERLTGLPEAS